MQIELYDKFSGLEIFSGSDLPRIMYWSSKLAANVVGKAGFKRMIAAMGGAAQVIQLRCCIRL